MTDKAISPLRQRLIEDMAIRRLGPKTQQHYIRHVKKFADFLDRSADKATAEDVHRYQLWLASIGTSVGTANVSNGEIIAEAQIDLSQIVRQLEPKPELGRIFVTAVGKHIKADFVLFDQRPAGVRRLRRDRADRRTQLL